MEDVDGNRYVDFDMGFGALFAGHCHPIVRSAIERQLDDGTLFVTPCELNADVAEMLAARYGLPMWRFTNSGTEATMDAIRVARGVTGRDKIVKVEGGYHGHHDEVMISMKPPISEAGPADEPRADPGDGRHHPCRARPTPRSSRTTDADAARAGARRRRRGLLHRRAGHGEHRHLPAAARLPEGRARDHPQVRHDADLRRGQDRHHRRVGRGDGRCRRAARPRRAGQEHRRRVAARRVRRDRRSAWTRSPAARCCTSARTTATRCAWRRPRPCWPRCARPKPRQAAIDLNRRVLDACQRTIDGRRPAGAHGPVRREGLRHVGARADPELPRLQGHRLRPRLRAVDPRHQPRRAAAAGPRRAVAHLGDAHARPTRCTTPTCSPSSSPNS